MNRTLAFLRRNPAPAAMVSGILLGGLTLFPYLLGLNGAIGGGLGLLVVGATFGLYRLLSRGPVDWSEQLSMKRFLAGGLGGLLVVGVAIQAVPLGWDRSNPPVTGEPPWDSPRTRELVVRACFDCHSNEVVYPWYSQVAPMSWAVALHVAEGRDEVNYSEWDRPQDEADESAETVREGEMPPAYYTRLTHPGARLSDAELRDLISGLDETFGSSNDDD